MCHNYPKITIIVPIYKVERFLCECIDSLIKQTYDNIEIILVDDGSPDKCPEICDEYLNIDSRIKVIHKNNGGLSEARNVGIDMASGNYIMFVDSDDIVDIHIVEKLLEVSEKNNSDIVCCQFRYINETSHIQHSINNLKKNIYIPKNKCMFSLLTARYVGVYAWAKLYKKKLFEGIRYPVGKLHEDVFTTYKLVDQSNSITAVPDELYFYRKRNNSITSQRVSLQYLDAIDAKIALNNFIKTHYPHLLNYSKALLGYSASLTIYKILKSASANLNQYLPNLRIILKDNITQYIIYGRNKLSSKIAGLGICFAFPIVKLLINTRLKYSKRPKKT